MESSTIDLHSDKSNNQAISMWVGAGRILRPILLIFMLFWIMLLSSCMVPGPGHERHGGNDRREHNDHNDHHDHHDNNDHHNN
jgi:hypothetical protein